MPSRVKSENLSDVNAGLVYLSSANGCRYSAVYDAHIIPVGKDQKQHIEIARDIARAFNNQYGDVFVVPEASIRENVMMVPGIDGRKMSKSYNNYIDIFIPDKKMRKQIMKIQTDAKTLEEPKDPDTCLVFQIYSLVASDEGIEEMRKNYLAGNYGYGHAKVALYETLLTKYAKERELYKEYMEDAEAMEKALRVGEEKAQDIANAKLKEVRKILGF